MSEKRDSNPRPRPWQGRALPTELFSHPKRFWECKFKEAFLIYNDLITKYTLYLCWKSAYFKSPMDLQAENLL